MPARLVSLVPLALLLALAACTASERDHAATPARAADFDAPGHAVPSDTFGAYWYQGLAEITTYDLQQVRYGEVHPGEATLIYVTEPFLESTHVKADDPDADGAVTVLKLNAARTFTTGIYPYAMMTSVFAPVQGGGALKVTTSAQEWCGHTFTQLNRTAEGYRMRLFSYFEQESDQDRTLSAVRLEDDLWVQLRLDPNALPTGELSLVPGTFFQRFSHRPLAPERATAALTDSATAALTDSAAVRTYTLTYPDLGRTLAVTFTASFPHPVERWAETRRSRGEELTTVATRRARRMLPYWQLNGREHATYRDSLGLAP